MSGSGDQNAGRRDGRVPSKLSPAVSESLSSFSDSILAEHLEEISFLHGQRETMLLEPALSWRDLQPFEERLEKHLAAIAWCGDRAATACAAKIAEGDAGEVYGALRVLCRLAKVEALVSSIAGRCAKGGEPASAAAQALGAETKGEWQKLTLLGLAGTGEALWPVAARVVGWQRLPMRKFLLDAFERQNPAPEICWAAGRLGLVEAAPGIHKHAATEDAVLRDAAVRALLTLGDRRMVDELGARVTESWTHLPLALCCGPAAAHALVDAVKRGTPEPQSLLALGALGVPEAVEILIAQLEEETLNATAAAALAMITGAPLVKERFEPEEVRREELFPDEIAKLDKGESLTPPGEKPRGRVVTEIDVDPASWKSWWANNSSRFRQGQRYLNGQPTTPTAVVAALNASFPAASRELMLAELTIRHHCEVFADIRMTVLEQEAELAKMSEWAKREAARFRPGGWYYHGEALAT